MKSTYRRIATTVACPTSVTRSRRNATEKSAKENTLAIAMNGLRDRGTRDRLTRRRGCRTAARRRSRTRDTHRNDTAAGRAAARMIRRYAPASPHTGRSSARRPSVTTGPMIAPAVSMLRWNPNAFPRASAGVDSVSSASRGASRTPFPSRSTIRMPKNCGHAAANGNRTFITVERPYPASTNPFRLPATSDHRPDTTFMNATTASAVPSMSPTMSAFAPRARIR